MTMPLKCSTQLCEEKIIHIKLGGKWMCTKSKENTEIFEITLLSSNKRMTLKDSLRQIPLRYKEVQKRIENLLISTNYFLGSIKHQHITIA